jgi:hypothetical protein
LAAVGASIVGAIAVLATVMTNLTTIGKSFESFWHMFDSKTPTSAQQSRPQAAAPEMGAPKKVVKVCMGNGGGDNCLAGADAKYDCNTYSAMGGGGQKTYEVLGDSFCGYRDKDNAWKVAPHTTVVIQNNGGGQCGWTAFQVTCNP